MSNRKRGWILAVTALFIVAAFALRQPSGFARQAQDDRQKLAKDKGPAGTLKDRLEEDDGYAGAIFFSADVGGNLEVCGCPIKPLGGIARRLGYINAWHRRSPDAAIITVDAGHIFSDEMTGNDLNPDAKLMNDWIVRANEKMEMSAVNLSYRDVVYGGRLFQKGAALRPEKTSVISANARKEGLEIQPYVIKTFTAKRLKKPLRIAFIGISDLPPADFKDAVAKSGFTFTDPLEAAKSALAAVSGKSDLNVIIGYFRPGLANKLANQNPELDVIISYDDRGIVSDPKQVGNALIVFASHQTKYLGELRFYADSNGQVERFTNRYVELDNVIPDDPQMLVMTKQARQEIDIVQRRMAEEAVVEKPAGPSIYATSSKCAQCHEDETAKWKETRHAHAFAALATKNRSFDNACVGCHSVGFQNQGFVNIKATPEYADVQCESCHGPGAAHASKPIKGNYKTPATPGLCITCHDHDNSPDFVFDKYWPLVAHGKKQK